MIASRNLKVDYLRAFAIIAIIVCHTNYLWCYLNPAQRAFLFTIGKFGVPLFFFISGYLNIRESCITLFFLKKRFKRVLPPFVIWLLLYNFYDLEENNTSFLFAGLTASSAHLWFVFALSGLYLITPILSSFFCNCERRTYKIYLFLSSVPFLYDYFCVYFNLPMSDDHNPMFSFNLLSGYLFYYLLGFYCKRFPQNHLLGTYSIKFEFLIIGLLIVFYGILAYIGIKYLNLTPYQVTKYTSPTGCLYSLICIHFMFKVKIDNIKLSHIVLKLSNDSFGIYLIHMFVYFGVTNLLDMVLVVSMMSSFRVLLINIVCAIITLIISDFFVSIIKKMPYNRYIVG